MSRGPIAQEATEDVDMEAQADEQAVQKSDNRQLPLSEQRAVGPVRRLHVSTSLLS